MTWFTSRNLACVAATSFPFQMEFEHVSEKAGERRSTLCMSKNWGEVGEGVSKKGEEVGRKGIMFPSLT